MKPNQDTDYKIKLSKDTYMWKNDQNKVRGKINFSNGTNTYLPNAHTHQHLQNISSHSL